MGKARTVKVRFTPAAITELDSILDYVAIHSPNGAHRVRSRIKAMIQILEQHPESGQRTNVQSLRRMVATPYPYLIFYQIIGGEVVIVGIRHGARDRD